jgi:predicted nuclease of predicted toxin-antitoxin system
VKIVIDMNLSPRWRQVLVDAGIEAVHWSVIGMATAPDSQIFTYARENAAVVLTSDLDFGSILAATGAAAPSVIQLRSDDVRPEAAGGAVIAAIEQSQDALDGGALLTIDAERLRVTLLPLVRR